MSPHAIAAVALSPLDWRPEGYRRWSAWATVDGAFTPFAFDVLPYTLGVELRVYDVLRKPAATYGLPILRVMFGHREWTIEQIQPVVETLRPLLPTFEGPQTWTADELREAHRSRKQLPTKCAFVHAFPIDADESTICQCGRVTKGWANAGLSR